MSAVWVGISLVAALMALCFEFLMAVREKGVRLALEQPLDRPGKEKKRFYQILFVTSLLALILALGLSGTHRRFVRPVQGVAIALDTTIFPSGMDPQQQLSIEKAAILELIHSLPGVPLSLYELRGGAVHLVVPPTIDTLYFELQLDGILPSPSSGKELFLDGISKDIVQRFPGVPPWVVVVSPEKLPSGGERVDDVVYIEVQTDTISCTFRQRGVLFKGQTIQKAALKMIERLNRSALPTPPDPTESFVLTCCTGVAWLCFIIWRKSRAPLFILGMVLASFSQAFAVSNAEANAMVIDASNLAEANDFEAGKKAVESLLAAVADPQGRQRLIYDRALLSYLDGKDTDALLWLTMEGSTVQGARLPEAVRLQGIVLIRLVTQSVDEQEQQRSKNLLQQWLRNNSEIDGEIRAAATMALFSPSVQETQIEVVQKTLLWLEQSVQGVGNNERVPLLSAGELLAQKTTKTIEKLIQERWPKDLVVLYSKFMSQVQKRISTFRIWCDFANAPTQNEAISFLLQQASMSAHMAVFFPKYVSEANKDIDLVVSMLKAAIPAFPEESQRFLTWLLEVPSGEGKQRAAYWYARAVLWPAVQQFSALDLKPIALLLCQEVDVISDTSVRETLANLIMHTCSLPKSSSSGNDSLEVLLQKVLSLWYQQDPEDTLDTLLQLTDTHTKLWAPRLFTLLMPHLRQVNSRGNSMQAQLVQGIGDDIGALDPVLVGRLWQLSISPTDTPQEVRGKVDHLLLLFSELLSRLSSPSDSVLRSFILIFSIQPRIAEQMTYSQVFHNTPQKREIYDQLLGEWNSTCNEIQQRIAEPATFRLPKVKQEIEVSLAILRRLQALLSEGESFSSVSSINAGPLSVQRRGFSMQGEDAVRLFQEMDRSDRELYGE
jgi:hypothetical protein